eukprot:c55634_g1_i1 orf=2-451(-)
MKMADLSLHLHETQEKARTGGTVFTAQGMDIRCQKYRVSESLPPLLKLSSTGAYPFLVNDAEEVPEKHTPAEKTHYRCCGETVRRDRLSKIPHDVGTALPDADSMCEKGNSINHDHGIPCEDSSRIDCNADGSALSNPVNGRYQIFPVDA